MVRLLLGLLNSSYTRSWFQKSNLLTSSVFLNSLFLFLFYLTHSTCLKFMVHGEGSYLLLLYCTPFRRRTIPWRALVHSVLSPFGPVYCNHSLVSSFSWHIRQRKRSVLFQVVICFGFSGGIQYTAWVQWILGHRIVVFVSKTASFIVKGYSSHVVYICRWPWCLVAVLIFFAYNTVASSR